VDRALNIVAIGEVLWDIIGTERHLGGAPFNFAAHCHHLGARSAIISRVGRDELGDEILTRARDLGVDAGLIQCDAEHPTGQVRVTLRADGQPEFDICTGAAYDYLAADPAAVARIRAADVVCFGTLAQRHRTAQRSIATLLEVASLRQNFTELSRCAQSTAQALIVCDLNLRPPHYSIEVVRDSLSRCHLLKLNDDELRIVQGMLGQDDLDEDGFLLHLLEAYGLELAKTLLRITASTLLEAVGEVGTVDDFVGHVGEDDFVVTTVPARAQALMDRIKGGFKSALKDLGTVIEQERARAIKKGGPQDAIPLLDLFIGLLTSKERDFTDIRELAEAAAKARRRAEKRLSSEQTV